MRNARKVSLEKPDGKKYFSRSANVYGYNIKISFREKCVALQTGCI